MKNKRALLGIVIFLLGIIFITGGLFLGYKLADDSSVEKKFTTKEQTDVRTIAVVNLDEGIVLDEKTINYANELIDFTDENLVNTSLEDARNGVEEGIYAAYVIIPATFSQNVNSINETPVESEIQYTLHDNLTSQAGLTTMSNIYMLIKNLNNNVSYMYVDSILNEFHLAQDNAEEIMANGQVVNKAVNDIEADDISANVDLPSDESMEFSPENVDFSGYLKKNSEVISEINQEYSDGYAKSEKEKENLASSANSLGDTISSTNSKLKSIDIEHDDEGNYVYDAELESLSDSLNDYNDELSNSVQSIGDTLEKTVTSISEYETQLNEINKCYLATIEKYNSDTAEKIGLLYKELSAGKYVLNIEKSNLSFYGDTDEGEKIIVSYPNGEDIEYILVGKDGNINLDLLYGLLSDLITNKGVVYTTQTNISITDSEGIQAKIEENILPFDENEVYKKNDENGFEKQSSSISSMIAAINTNFEELKTDLNGFEESELSGINTETIVENVKGDVVNKLSENAKNITSAIIKEYDKEEESLVNFSNNLLEYNPFAYINQKAIQEKYSELNASTSSLETAIQNKNSSDMEVMNTIYTKYNENLTSLRESIYSAVDSSNQSVESGLKNAQNTLAAKNSRNEELLEAFVKKLPYTRNGSLGNYKIYKFIVEPCESQNLTMVKNEIKPKEIVNEHKDNILDDSFAYVVLLMVVVLILSVLVVAILSKKHQKNNYNL